MEREAMRTLVNTGRLRGRRIEADGNQLLAQIDRLRRRPAAGKNRILAAARHTPAPDPLLALTDQQLLAALIAPPIGSTSPAPTDPSSTVPTPIAPSSTGPAGSTTDPAAAALLTLSGEQLVALLEAADHPDPAAPAHELSAPAGAAADPEVDAFYAALFGDSRP